MKFIFNPMGWMRFPRQTDGWFRPRIGRRGMSGLPGAGDFAQPGWVAYNFQILPCILLENGAEFLKDMLIEAG